MAHDSALHPPHPDLGFDPDALREKYRRERDKRLRADGNDQYRRITGELAGYLDDPNAEPGFTRDALTDEIDVAIIGGGFSGLLAGARLRVSRDLLLTTGTAAVLARADLLRPRTQLLRWWSSPVPYPGLLALQVGVSG